MTKEIRNVCNKKTSRMHQSRNQYPQRYGIANPQASQHHEPLYQQPAPMPSTQLMAPTYLPPAADNLVPMSNTSMAIGDNDMNMMSTDATMGTSANPYANGNYLMDPGMMTPSTMSDIKGLQTFMPYMGGGVGNAASDGPVDPATGLPLFTTGKLVRSQLLGGVGQGSFLRQVQDPLSGSAKIGRYMYPCRGTEQRRDDFEVRRKQFNAARLESNDSDPVLFNLGEFVYY
ncbi:MAG: hypothetical protein K0U52_03680 [Gammaproteobacteria bacterium]|nr:hypothetical protein [Gammaproteobacteria bacterium]